MKKNNKFKKIFSTLFISTNLVFSTSILTQNNIVYAKTINRYNYVRGASQYDLNSVTNLTLNIENAFGLTENGDRQKGYSFGYLRKLDKNLKEVSDLWIDAGLRSGLNDCTFVHACLQNDFRKLDILCFNLSVKGHVTSVVLMDDGSLNVVDIMYNHEKKKFEKIITPLKNYLEKQFEEKDIEPETNFPDLLYPTVNCSFYQTNCGRSTGASVAIYLRYILQKFKEADNKFDLANKLEAEIIKLEESWCPYCWPYIVVGDKIAKYSKNDIWASKDEKWVPMIIFPDYRASSVHKELNNINMCDDYDELIEKLSMLHSMSVDQIHNLISNFEKYEGKSYSIFMDSKPFAFYFDKNKNSFGWDDSKKEFSKVSPRSFYSAQKLYNTLQNLSENILHKDILGNFKIPIYNNFVYVTLEKKSKFGEGFYYIESQYPNKPAYLLSKPFSSFSDESLYPQKNDNQNLESYGEHKDIVRNAISMIRPFYHELPELNNTIMENAEKGLDIQLDGIIELSRKFGKKEDVPPKYIPTREQYCEALHIMNMSY